VAVHRSHNVYTGKGRVIDLDAMGIFMQAVLAGKDLKGLKDTLVAAGKTNVYEVTTYPKVDWDAEQAAAKAKVDADIAAWESNTNAVEVKGKKPKSYAVQPKPAWLVDALKVEGDPEEHL
jgi:hypothetical protein